MKRRTKQKTPRAMASRPDAGRRRRRLRALAAVAVVGIVAAATVLALRLAAADAERDGVFRLTALEVHGLRLLTGEEVLGASGVQVGAALFEVDLDSVASRLERLVWVRSARVERKPPDRLVVQLEERRRSLWIEWQGRLHGLDSDAVLLPPDRLPTEGITDLDLPVLRVAALEGGDSLAVGAAVTDSSVRRLVDWWVRARRVAPDLAAEISQIEPLGEHTLGLRLIADDLQVRLPYGRVAQRLGALREVLARVYGECPNPAYVDLRFEGQAVIGTQAATATPARLPARTGRNAGAPEENLGHG